MSDFHVCNLLLNQLIFPNLFPKLAAFRRVFCRGIQDGAGETQGARRTAQTRGVELRHAHLESFIELSQQKTFGDFYIFKGQFRRVGSPQADFLVNLFTGDARQAIVHNKAAHAVGACVFIRFDVQQAVIGNGTVGDPHFVTVDQIVIAFIVGVAFHRGDIRANIRFGHCKTADIFATDKPGNVVSLLFLRAEFLNGKRRTPTLHVESHPPGGMDFGDLFNGQRAFQKAHAVAAVLLFEGETEKSQFGHFKKYFFAPEMIFLVFFYMRRNFFFGKTSGRVLNHLLFFR